MFKKVVIADQLARLVNLVYNDPDNWQGLIVIVATYCFAIQIYCDFSGYTDIAIGAARVMGFDLRINFREPYLAQSIAGFWRRWHISLSTWFRDYLYIPLGGNRISSRRTYLNLMIVVDSIRAHKEKSARTEETVRYQISVTRHEEAIKQAEALVGWRVYATNATGGRLSLTDAVLTYRNQYLVEQPFGRLKGRFLSITPLFVQRDDHAIGLIRLLTLAVRLLILSDYTARCTLAEENGELLGVSAGNPKRGTKQPTTERMLRAFKHITLTVININGQTIRHVTPLTDVQQRILSLFGLSTCLYTSDLIA